MILKHWTILGAATTTLLLTGGCGSESDAGPPTIRYDDSICDECGMIISDERFATATIIQGDRGNEPMIFDDFNCQIIFENKHTDLTITGRWSNDYSSKEWLETQNAWFVKSPNLRTPMASNMAAFASKEEAQSFAKTIDGDTVDFQSAWVFMD